ncbi:MAG: hypothetical protein R3253_15500, partial [Longimicrobiales bacterium]|nr:hypothetical protein [Longimicrobiales bacterium]
ATGTIQKPFLNEFADHAFRQVAARRDDYFGYALPPELGFTPAYLRYRADLVELTYQRRFGDTAGPRGLLGLGISHESFQVPQEPGSTRAVVDGDFDRTQEAPPAVRDALLAQAEPYATKRLTLYLGVRDVHYVLRQGLDAITALQDLMVGSSVTLALGRGFAVGVDDQSDLLARLQARVGVIGPSHYLQARTDVHARRPTGRALGAGSWRDVVGSVWADGYWSQSGWASLYVRGRASAGWNTQRPFQIRLGGREGIRAYTEDAFPGGQLVFGSVEQRFVLPVGPSFADLGFAFFADGGRTWAGDVPFGQDSGWQGGIGAGLRASPAGARRVFRVDATLPLGALRNERGVTLRIYGEIFGVLDRRRWPHQVDRSRWYGNDPDLSRRVPDPLARN